MVVVVVVVVYVISTAKHPENGATPQCVLRSYVACARARWVGGGQEYARTGRAGMGRAAGFPGTWGAIGPRPIRRPPTGEKKRRGGRRMHVHATPPRLKPTRLRFPRRLRPRRLRLPRLPRLPPPRLRLPH